MMSEGLSEEEARRSIWLVDRYGLVHSEAEGIEGFQKEFAQPVERLAGWDLARKDHITLEETVRHVRPTILIGTAAQPLAFTEPIVREMARHADRPIIFPLSNPTSKSEALPSDLIAWTGGRALIATGSPFADVAHGGRLISTGQCNNAYIFPGIGLGVIASRARRVNDEIFVAAARALSELSPVHDDPSGSLFPPLEQVREVSRHVAFEVGVEAQRAGLAEPSSEQELERRISAKMWNPRYVRYRKR
jgi:malate dehydrogenase (oxaloacetate-decarboxylating)